MSGRSELSNVSRETLIHGRWLWYAAREIYDERGIYSMDHVITLHGLKDEQFIYENNQDSYSRLRRNITRSALNHASLCVNYGGVDDDNTWSTFTSKSLRGGFETRLVLRGFDGFMGTVDERISRGKTLELAERFLGLTPGDIMVDHNKALTDTEEEQLGLSVEHLIDSVNETLQLPKLTPSVTVDFKLPDGFNVTALRRRDMHGKEDVARITRSKLIISRDTSSGRTNLFSLTSDQLMNGDWQVHTTRFGTPQIVLGPEEAVSAINMIDNISGQVNNMAPRSIEKSEPGRSFSPRPVIPIDTVAAEHLVFLESMASEYRDRYR